tara:strand:+ start:212 stop:322 length:111 start_codon:yes stop_codon:yes gene_type:complete
LPSKDENGTNRLGRFDWEVTFPALHQQTLDAHNEYV